MVWKLNLRYQCSFLSSSPPSPFGHPGSVWVLPVVSLWHYIAGGLLITWFSWELYYSFPPWTPLVLYPIAVYLRWNHLGGDKSTPTKKQLLLYLLFIWGGTKWFWGGTIHNEGHFRRCRVLKIDIFWSLNDTSVANDISAPKVEIFRAPPPLKCPELWIVPPQNH